MPVAVKRSAPGCADQDAKAKEGRSTAGCDSNSPVGFQGYSAWTIDGLGAAIHRQRPQVDREIMGKAGGGGKILIFSIRLADTLYE